MSASPDVQRRFELALEVLLEKLKQDRTILAAVLMGSLAHDVVWEKSDIDLLLVTQDEKNARDCVFLVEADVNIHASLASRSEFRALVERSLGSSFMHSTLAKSRLLYSRDETIGALWRNLQGNLGGRDRAVALLHAATHAVPALDKARKHCAVKSDPHGAYLWLTRAYTGLAQIEVYLHDSIAGREVMEQALAFDPKFFGRIYSELMDQPKTAQRVAEVLDEIDAWLLARAPLLFRPILEHLAEQGDIRSVTDLEAWFRRQLDLEGVAQACEWLADHGLIRKLSAPVRLTRRSAVDLEEMAFQHEPDPA